MPWPGRASSYSGRMWTGRAGVFNQDGSRMEGCSVLDGGPHSWSWRREGELFIASFTLTIYLSLPYDFLPSRNILVLSTPWYLDAQPRRRYGI